MARSGLARKALPREAQAALQKLGSRLRRARITRKWTVAELAERMFVTPATVRRLEQGHPGTSLGVMATALHLFELTPDLDRMATLDSDRVSSMRLSQALPQRVRRSPKGHVTL